MGPSIDGYCSVPITLLILVSNIGINSGNIISEVNDMGRVTPLIVLPDNKLDKIWVENDTSTGIKYRRTLFTLKVSGYKGLITVSKESLHVSLRLLLDDRTDLFVGGLFANLAGKVENRYINSGDREIHACGISLHRSGYIGHSLCRSSRGGDDVTRGSTETTPVLAEE